MIFDLDGTVFIHLALFLFTMLMVKLLFLNPHFALRDRRTAATTGRMAEATALADEAFKLENDCDHIESESYAEATRNRDEARRTFLAEAETIKRSADAESVRLSKEKLAVEEQLSGSVEELSSELSAKLMRRKG